MKALAFGILLTVKSILITTLRPRFFYSKNNAARTLFKQFCEVTNLSAVTFNDILSVSNSQKVVIHPKHQNIIWAHITLMRNLISHYVLETQPLFNRQNNTHTHTYIHAQNRHISQRDFKWNTKLGGSINLPFYFKCYWLLA